jgi:hypothetical protein
MMCLFFSGGRIRLIEIDQLLKNKFDIHYKNLNGVHNLNRWGFLVVSGTHMSRCGSIKKVRHHLVGNTFIVSVDDEPLTLHNWPMCTMELVDFSKTISLPLYGLKDGELLDAVSDGLLFCLHLLLPLSTPCVRFNFATLKLPQSHRYQSQ